MDDLPEICASPFAQEQAFIWKRRMCGAAHLNVSSTAFEFKDPHLVMSWVKRFIPQHIRFVPPYYDVEGYGYDGYLTLDADFLCDLVEFLHDAGNAADARKKYNVHPLITAECCDILTAGGEFRAFEGDSGLMDCMGALRDIASNVRNEPHPWELVTMTGPDFDDLSIVDQYRFCRGLLREIQGVPLETKIKLRTDIFPPTAPVGQDLPRKTFNPTARNVSRLPAIGFWIRSKVSGFSESLGFRPSR